MVIGGDRSIKGGVRRAVIDDNHLQNLWLPKRRSDAVPDSL